MRKQIFFIALTMTLLLILAGCGPAPINETPDKVDAPDVDNELAVEEPEEVGEDISQEEDKDFINPFVDYNNKDYSYEVETLVDGESFVQKFWISGNKRRYELVPSEIQDNVITIVDGDEKVQYYYQPEDNTVMIGDYVYSPKSFDDSRDSNYMDSLIALFDDDGKLKVEKGNLDGESVQIITGNIGELKNILWISTRTRFPLKREQYYEDGELEAVSLFRNFSTEAIDQSLFVIPEGVKVTD